MKEILGKIKKADIVIIIAVAAILIILGAVALGANKFFSKSPVLEEKDVLFSVFFRGITVTDTETPFKPDEDTFITIRNVPYTKLKIVNVVFDRRQTLIETDKKGTYKPVEDISQPCVFDFVVTVKDRAKVTEDGAVVGGNKIKMGIPVILEGKNYKFTGVISNVQYAEDVEKQIQAAQQNQQGQNQLTQQKTVE